MTFWEQLRSAWERSGLTLDQLLKLSGLSIERVSLSRKLSGKRGLRDREIHALAGALGIVVASAPASAPEPAPAPRAKRRRSAQAS